MTVYNMPIWLRNHEYHKLVERLVKPSQEAESKKWEEAKDVSRIQIPKPTATYTTKASKK